MGVNQKAKLLQIDKKWNRCQPETYQNLQQDPLNQIGVDAEAHSGREESDPFLPFTVDEVRQSEDAGENSDKEG